MMKCAYWAPACAAWREDGSDLVVGEPGHDGGDAHAGGNAPVAEPR